MITQYKKIYETNTILNDGEEPLKVDDIVETINHFQCFDYISSILFPRAGKWSNDDLGKKLNDWNNASKRKVWGFSSVESSVP